MAASSASLGGASASDLLRSSTSGFNGVPLRTLGKGKLVLKRRDFTVVAKLRKVKKHEYPWPANPDPNVKGGVLIHLSQFKPLKEKPKPVTLDFEKPLVDLQKKIVDVRNMANETGLDFSDQIVLLETKYNQALRDLYTHLTPIQRVNIARHPNRPTFLDHVFNITEKFIELHGDRAGYDDPAIVTGLGTIDGRSYMFIGHQKGRNTKENIQRNFGMPTPHGYRKALRLMEYADHHGFPIVTFIDTPGAYADLKSEELGQGEAIAHNLRSMFGLKVPIISIVIGEGGSGGALAIGCANKLLMLENAVFYVASPEACAAILWKSAKAAPKAAEKLKITATELCQLQIADGVIPEPLGGAHADPDWTSQQIKKAIKDTMDELTKMNTEDLLKHRMLKFRKIGGFQEGIPIDPERKAKMKKRDLSIAKIPDAELEVEVEKLKQQVLKAKKSSPVPPKLGLDEMIKQLEREVDLEFFEAVEASGLTDSLPKLLEDFSKANADNQIVDPLLKDQIEKARQQLRAAPNYGRLHNKLKYLRELSKVERLSDTNKDEVESQVLKLEVKVPDSDLEVEVEKLKQQVLKANKSSPVPPKLDLDEMIKQLEREVVQEYSEAVKAIGLTDSLLKLREEVSKANADNQIVDPLLKDQIEKLRVEVEQQLRVAPNYGRLQNMLKYLRELSKVKRLSDINKDEEAATFKQELKEKLDTVLNNPRMKENFEALKAEIRGAGASSASDLDEELKKKIIEFKKEVESQLVNALESAGIEVIVKQDNNGPGTKEVIEEIQEQIGSLINSSDDIKSKILQLKLEVAKAEETPDSESKDRIDALVQQIKQSLAEAIDSASLKNKYENLVSNDGSLEHEDAADNSLTDDGSLEHEDPAGDSLTDDGSLEHEDPAGDSLTDDGSLEHEDPAGDSLTDDQLRVKVGANRTIS